MQRTTLWTYPPLIAVEPIKGVVYKATQLNRPHPKLSVMSIDEVQKHEKRESAEMTTKLCRKRNKHSSVPDPRPPVRALTTATPAVVKTRADQDVSVHLPKKNPQVTLDNTKPGPIRRLKNAWKKMFTPKDSTKSATACRTDEPNAPDPSSNDILQSGFHCGLDGCNSCSSPIPSTPLPGDPIGRTLMVAPGVELIFEDVSCFESGFTSSLSAFSSTASILSPASIDLDVFPDFDGVYIEPTPPHLAPIRPSSAFVEKSHDTMVWHTIEDLAADSSSSSDEEENIDDTDLTTPDILLTPKASASTAEEWHSATSTPCPEVPSTPKVSSEGEDWHSARSTPCSRGLEVPYEQREWSFEVSSTAMRVLRYAECAARGRQVTHE